MGLDMYLTGVKTPKRDFDRREDGFRIDQIRLELGYWRKHPNLHGYIVNTFAGGDDQCQEIDLDEDALIKIMRAIKNRELPSTSGFFFGTSAEPGTPEQDTEIEEDLGILVKALEWLTSHDETKEWSREVIYRASW